MDKIDPTGGRKALQELLASQSKRTQKLAWKVARETAAAIQSGKSAAQAVSAAMDHAGMAQSIRGNVAEAVAQSLCIGSGIWPKVEGHADLERLKEVALQHTWDDTGMTLSSRLHGTNAAMRADVVDAVNSLVQARDSTWQASRKIYDGYGLGGAINRAKLSELPGDLTTLLEKAQGTLSPEALADLKLRAKQLGAYADRLATGPLRASYLQFASRLEKGLTTGLDKLVRTATEEKARYHADRILRTEAARAWGQGFAKQCMDDPDVIGWRWETSSAHKIFDICDFHARADLYGMGPGIYPKAHHPSYPAHPHCLCHASMVFKGEAPAPSDQVAKGGKDAIAGMTEAERVRILGKPGAQAFKGGGDWKSSIKMWDPPAAFDSGVISWQPPLEFSPGAKAVLQEATASVPKVRFADDGRLLPGEALTRKELDASWAKINGAPILDAWRISGKAVPLGLDEREAAMIYDYTGSGYNLLNSDLRDGNPPHEVHIAQQQVLNSALTKMGLSRETETYRNLRLYGAKLTEIETTFVPGFEFEWKAFTSSSTDPRAAAAFGGVSFVIQNPLGVDIRKISGIPMESEFLIPSGSRFVVKEVANVPGIGYIYKVEAR